MRFFPIDSFPLPSSFPYFFLIILIIDNDGIQELHTFLFKILVPLILIIKKRISFKLVHRNKTILDDILFYSC